MRVVWQLLAVVAVSVVGSQLVFRAEDNPWLAPALGCLTAVAAVLVYRWVVGKTERRPVTEAARAGAVSGIGGGTLAGVALFGMVIVSIAVLGGYHVTGLGSVSGAVVLFGFMAAAAVTEEVVFRGVLFRVVEERVGTWISLVVTSVLFGLAHMSNPNSTLLGLVILTVGAGTLLTAAYVATRSLWLPIGLHFGWNLAGSAIFSTEVSGNDTVQGLLDAGTEGPVLLTGGVFGPEASLFSLVFPVLAAVVLLRVARRRGHLVPRRRAERTGASTTLPR
ncbi:CPBP family intramembrane glutamic endopeptidase [Streptomonospora algeriensis]|uniref:CPBP family intramembrane glutamic endopeptidase n=1 Tax=Streptomonospora algeriensis TaxID=995084 RepID=A0ABW3B9E7_9ACTN